MTKREAVFTQEPGNKKMTIVRSFDAPLKQVWDAWTKSELLEQWWAPKPYRAVTKTMDFRPGGFWLYAMTSPDGDITWCIENYRTIDPEKSITNSVSFCDEDRTVNQDFPTMYWNKQFSDNGTDTTVTIGITFDKEEDLKTIVEMGFKEGFNMGMDNLDELLGK